MGQEVDEHKVVVKTEQTPTQVQANVAEEISEEEYYSESGSSDENESQPKLTPSHTI